MGKRAGTLSDRRRIPFVPQRFTFAFGPFRLDAQTRRLFKNDEPLALNARQFDLLCALVSKSGEILSKDELIQIGWQGIAVSDNSLEQAISTLRRVLGPAPSGEYISTEARRGYRFGVPVTRPVTRNTDAALKALLAPHRAWIEGRAALETLERDRIEEARTAFEGVLESAPEQAPAHVGVANAYALQFETTRADAAPDLGALEKASYHAQEACRLDATYGEAWATLGFVLDRTGRHADALAAARRAVTLEPDNWRHHLRLAYIAWGEERLRAANRTLGLLPNFPIAHWLAATVHVARNSLSEAARELDAGIALHNLTTDTRPRFSPVALHWLRGLLYLSQGEEAKALDAFERELSAEASGHLYARECCANTWYAIGALHFWRAEMREARLAFEEAIDRVQIHSMAQLALAAVEARLRGARAPIQMSHARLRASTPVDIGLPQAAAIVLASAGHGSLPSDETVHQAAQVLDQALVAAPAGSAGWLIPVEPLLRVHRAPGAWAGVLAHLRARAV